MASWGTLVAIASILTATLAPAPAQAADAPEEVALAAQEPRALEAAWRWSEATVEAVAPPAQPVWTGPPYGSPSAPERVRASVLLPTNVSIRVSAPVVNDGVTIRWYDLVSGASMTYGGDWTGQYVLTNVTFTKVETREPLAVPQVLFGASQPAPAPTPAAPPLPDAPPRAPAPAWALPTEATGIRRPLGLLQALRDLLTALFEILRALGLLLLYHRVSPDRALDHALRARLHALVQERPGLHVAALAEALGAHPKTLGYHLRVLERGRLVRLVPDGRTLRVHPVAQQDAEHPDTSARRQRLLDLLQEGALTREELARLLGITPQAVSYHIGLLERQGRVRARWIGRSKRYDLA